MRTKVCNRCRETKSITEFDTANKEGTLFQFLCRSCRKEYNRERYIKYRDKYRESSNRTYRRLKKLWLEHKGTLLCEICGENHPATLDYHHIDPTTKEFNVSSAGIRSITKDKMDKEIKKCIVLCSNCHRKIHYKE